MGAGARAAAGAAVPARMRAADHADGTGNDARPGIADALASGRRGDHQYRAWLVASAHGRDQRRPQPGRGALPPARRHRLQGGARRSRISGRARAYRPRPRSAATQAEAQAGARARHGTRGLRRDRRRGQQAARAAAPLSGQPDHPARQRHSGSLGEQPVGHRRLHPDPAEHPARPRPQQGLHPGRRRQQLQRQHPIADQCLFRRRPAELFRPGRGTAALRHAQHRRARRTAGHPLRLGSDRRRDPADLQSGQRDRYVRIDDRRHHRHRR